MIRYNPYSKYHKEKIYSDVWRWFYMIWKKPSYYLIHWIILEDKWDTALCKVRKVCDGEIKECELSKKLLKFNKDIWE